MRRREVLILLSSAVLMGPITVRAQHRAEPARLGVLLFGTPATDTALGPFLAGVRELGYVEGRDLAIERRYGEGRPERRAGLAAELVRSNPDVLVAIGGDVVPAAKDATTRIPVVFITSSDPVRAGLVASLNHPGGNLTGVTLLATDLAAKRLELLIEVAPQVRRVAFLFNPAHADNDLAETQRAATAFKVDVIPLAVRRPEDLDLAFRAAIAANADALVVVASRLTSLTASQIMSFAAENQLPLVSGWGPWVRSGGLLTYGPNTGESAHRMAYYVDKILKGARPADLPVEQATKVELVINLKTAQALGLTVPDMLLAQADEVIQ